MGPISPLALMESNGDGGDALRFRRAVTVTVERERKKENLFHYPIGISYDSASQYLPDGSVCWMLLGGLKRREFYRMGTFPS